MSRKCHRQVQNKLVLLGQFFSSELSLQSRWKSQRHSENMQLPPSHWKYPVGQEPNTSARNTCIQMSNRIYYRKLVRKRNLLATTLAIVRTVKDRRLPAVTALAMSQILLQLTYARHLALIKILVTTLSRASYGIVQSQSSIACDRFTLPFSWAARRSSEMETLWRDAARKAPQI